MTIEPNQIIEYITKTQPHLLNLVLKHAKPYMDELDLRARSVRHGKIEVIFTVNNGQVEKMEFIEHKVWKREELPLDSKAK